MRYTFCLIGAVLMMVAGRAQKDRYAFAQTYFGAQGGWLTVAGKPQASHVAPDFLATRFIIGGTHFWNKADFYVSFPVVSGSLSENVSGWVYSDGVITGARFLPAGLSRKHPTPYAGIQWIVPGFAMAEGPVISESRLGLEAGVIQVFLRSWTAEAGVGYIPGQDYRYYTSRNETAKVRVPDLGVHLAVKKYFDFTAALSSEPARQYISALREHMRIRGGHNAFSIAAGPSSTIPLSAVPFAKQFPWLSDRPLIAIHPDFGIGYYLHKPDMAFRISYRPLTLAQEGYGLELVYKQRHWAFEAFKFLFDYKGFVPFLGFSGGVTAYTLQGADSSTVFAQWSGQAFSYALVMGWDIRPTDVDWLILRTNLRYMPVIALEVQGHRVTAHQLEFNFIQCVVYPERFLRMQQLKKEQ